jgi:hypothetical protein
VGTLASKKIVSDVQVVQAVRMRELRECMRKLHAGEMCVVGLRLASSPIRLSAGAKRFAQPHHPNCPSSDKPKIWQRASGGIAAPLHQNKAEMGAVPSRTSRWYACQYRRTCRSNLYANVSCCDPAGDEVRGRLTSGGRRLARVDVADDDDVDMNLFFTAEAVSRMARW